MNETYPLYSDGNLQFDDCSIAQDDFVFWRGCSGQRYLATVYNLEDLPDYIGVVVVFARKLADGRRQAITVLQVESSLPIDLPSLLPQLEAKGAQEAHIYFLAQTVLERQAVVFDLKDRCAPQRNSVDSHAA